MIPVIVLIKVNIFHQKGQQWSKHFTAILLFRMTSLYAFLFFFAHVLENVVALVKRERKKIRNFQSKSAVQVQQVYKYMKYANKK